MELSVSPAPAPTAQSQETGEIFEERVKARAAGWYVCWPLAHRTSGSLQPKELEPKMTPTDSSFYKRDLRE